MRTTDHSILRHDPLLHRVWEQMGRPAGCRVVGGYVRDRMLGRLSNDLDLTIEGDADEAVTPARALAESFGVRAHLLGTPPHRIWRIETPTIKIELWPLGGLTAEEDILRRDFSCNALGWELPDGPLVDLVGGLSDLKQRRLRAISRFNLESDPVRLLRGARFLAQLPTFELDEPTKFWIRELAHSLVNAPRERIGQELLTLLRGPAASRSLAQCLELDLFGPTSPAGKTDIRWIEANINAADALTSRRYKNKTIAPPKGERHGGAGVPPALSRCGSEGDNARLAFLFRAWEIPADSVLASYAWPKPLRENALHAARLLDDAYSTSEASAADRREFAWRAGSAFPALVALGNAIEPDQPGWTRWWRQWSRNPAALEDPQPLLTGTTISKITGIEPGPELGEVVKALVRAQVRGEIRSRGGAMTWLARSRPT